MLHFGQIALISVQISSYNSPCGPNCSYSIRFEGPISNHNPWTVADTTGSTENVPGELATLKSHFGELRRSRGLVRRAGFDTEAEIESLIRRTAYGISAVGRIQFVQARDGAGTGAGTGFRPAHTV